MLIFSTMDQNQRLNCNNLSAFSPVVENQSGKKGKGLVFSFFLVCVQSQTLFKSHSLRDAWTMYLTVCSPKNFIDYLREVHTGLIVEGGEADEHLHVDLSTAVDQEPEVLSC